MTEEGELGLKGITTDPQGNAWFYHGINKSSSIIKLNPQNGSFTQYKIGGNIVADDAVINWQEANSI
jgi:streptogramin lyase